MQKGGLIVIAALTASFGSACTSPRERMRERPPMVDAMTDGKLKGAVPRKVDESQRKSVPEEPWRIGDVIIPPASPGKGVTIPEPEPFNTPRTPIKPRL
ncbi:MAG: hypothetical protein AABW86_05600 [Candidatus Micrarchaeota archaeon]